VTFASISFHLHLSGLACAPPGGVAKNMFVVESMGAAQIFVGLAGLSKRKQW
jgi:hypothetical protein